MLEKKVRIESLAGAVSHGQVYILEWNRSERLAIAVRTWVLFWLAAIGFIFIPFIHFFLVPLCLVLGPILSFHYYRRSEMCNGGTGACPQCHEEFKIEKGATKWPLSDICEKCHCGVKIFLSE